MNEKHLIAAVDLSHFNQVKTNEILEIDYFGQKLELNLQRSRARRHTLSIVVKPGGQTIVRVPYRTSNSQIQSFVTEKASWIFKAIARAHAKKPVAKNTKKNFSYLGRIVDFEIVASPLLKKGGYCEWQNDACVVHIPGHILNEEQFDYAHNVIKNWLKAQSLLFLKSRADHFSARLNLSYTDIKVRAQKTRWGSCDQNGVLRLNWHVMQCPPEVIDYLVVHELCHIAHPDHSHRFWNLVGSILPDYARLRQTLKTYENF